VPSRYVPALKEFAVIVFFFYCNLRVLIINITFLTLVTLLISKAPPTRVAVSFLRIISYSLEL
jgi:hypothetical protein